MPRLAIFGGTFNPVHWGHLLMAETALNQVGLDCVLWTPTYQPAYKAAATVLNFQQRLEMVERAIAHHPHFALSTVEQNRSDSYAIHTLLNLQRRYPGSEWYWLLGLDAFEALPRWYRRQELAAHCCWLVAPRLVSGPQRETGERLKRDDQSLAPRTPPNLPDSKQPLAWVASSQERCEQVAWILAAESIRVQWQLLQMPLVTISSSLIRDYCRDRRSVRYLVPEAVRQYLLEHRLYQDSDLEVIP